MLFFTHKHENAGIPPDVRESWIGELQLYPEILKGLSLCPKSMSTQYEGSGQSEPLRPSQVRRACWVGWPPDAKEGFICQPTGSSSMEVLEGAFVGDTLPFARMRLQHTRMPIYRLRRPVVKW